MQKRVVLILVGAAILFFFSTHLKMRSSTTAPVASIQNNAVSPAHNRPQELKDSPALLAKENLSAEVSQFHSRVIQPNPMRQPSQIRYPRTDELSPHPMLTASKWLVWKNVLAVPMKNFTGNEVGFLGKASGFAFIHDENQKHDIENFDPSRPLVLYNSRLRQAGILTGTIKVELRDEATLPEFLADHHAVTIGEFPEIKTFYITSKSPPFRLDEFYQSVQTDARVQKCEIEILSRQYEK